MHPSAWRETNEKASGSRSDCQLVNIISVTFVFRDGNNITVIKNWTRQISRAMDVVTVRRRHDQHQRAEETWTIATGSFRSSFSTQNAEESRRFGTVLVVCSKKLQARWPGRKGGTSAHADWHCRPSGIPLGVSCCRGGAPSHSRHVHNGGVCCGKFGAFCCEP